MVGVTKQLYADEPGNKMWNHQFQELHLKFRERYSFCINPPQVSTPIPPKWDLRYTDIGDRE